MSDRKSIDKKMIENKIIDIAYRIDDLPFPPSSKDTERWEKELSDLNAMLMRLDRILGLE